MKQTTLVDQHIRRHPTKPHKKVAVHQYRRRAQGPGPKFSGSPPPKKPDSNNIFGDKVIYSYTREQALEDGTLIDVSEQAKDVGMTAPTAITPSVMSEVAVPKGLEGIQDERGRLHDVLWMASRKFIAKRRALQGQGMSRDQMEHELGLTPFEVIFQNGRGPRKRHTEKLWLSFNTYEGFTIMKPSEY